MDCHGKAGDGRKIGRWERWGDEREDTRNVGEKRKGKIRGRREEQRNGETKAGRMTHCVKRKMMDFKFKVKRLLIGKIRHPYAEEKQ